MNVGVYGYRLKTNVIYNDGKQDVYLDNLVERVRWSGDLRVGCRRLDVDFRNTKDLKTQLLSIKSGSKVRFLKDGTELFKGVLFTDDINITGKHSFTCYDENIYLSKNEDTKAFRNQKASQITQTLCSEFGIPVGQIQDTGYVIPKLLLRGKTLWQMIVIALTETYKATGRRFVCYSKGGKLYLMERKAQLVKWMLESGVNILQASYTKSIEDLRTRVKVVAEEKKKIATLAEVKNVDLEKLFGVMQHLEIANGDTTKAQATALANSLLKELGTIHDEATIEALGIHEVIAGTSVYVKEPMTKIMGGYYVVADEHIFEGAEHTMSVQLSATDDLPTLQNT